MSQENVEIVRRAVELFNESGVTGPGLNLLFTEDAEFHEPPEQPAPRIARGREEVRMLMDEFDSAWEEHRSEPKEIRAVGIDKVLLISVEHFKGRDGIELEAPHAAIFTLRDRKIVRWESFWDRRRALKAVGLPEQDAPTDSP